MASKEYEAVLKVLLEAVQSVNGAGQQAPEGIPVGVSNRHIHLSQADLDTLFGSGYQLTPIKDLSQPGQFACKETVTICGPKGAIEKIRVLGPVRSKTQIEILTGDGFKLGVKAPARLSGDLAGTPGITVIGPKGIGTDDRRSDRGTKTLFTCSRRKRLLTACMTDRSSYSIQVDGPRGGTLANVAIRATDTSALECHVDTEEANAMDMSSSTRIKIIK